MSPQSFDTGQWPWQGTCLLVAVAVGRLLPPQNLLLICCRLSQLCVLPPLLSLQGAGHAGAAAVRQSGIRAGGSRLFSGEAHWNGPAAPAAQAPAALARAKLTRPTASSGSRRWCRQTHKCSLFCKLQMYSALYLIKLQNSLSVFCSFVFLQSQAALSTRQGQQVVVQRRSRSSRLSRRAPPLSGG